MPVPSTMSELFAAAASNSPIDTDQVFPLNDDYIRAISSILRRKDAIGTAIASASTTDIGGSITGDIVHITGTATINAFTAATVAGITRVLVFDGALTINRSANILMDQTVKTVAGDVMGFVCEGAGVWRCIYQPSNQVCVLAGSGTYTSGGNLAQDGNIITCDFVSANTTTACTLDGVAIRGLTGATGIDNVIGSLTGIQRLRYNTANTCWIAIDQTAHYITISLAADVALPVGHTNVYDATAITNLELRTIVKSTQCYRISSPIYTASVANQLYIYPNGAGSASSFSSYHVVRNTAGTPSSQVGTNGALVAPLLTLSGTVGNFASVLAVNTANYFINSTVYVENGYSEAGNLYSTSNTITPSSMGFITTSAGNFSGRIEVERLS